MLMPLLLLLFALSPSTSGEPSTPTDGHFDTDRCEGGEMVCIVPGTCVRSNLNSLQTSVDKTKLDECPVILAIRPYSDSKYRVVIRGKGLDPVEDGIQLINSGAAPDSILFDCKPKGDEAIVKVGSNLQAGTNQMTFASTTEKYIHCEFEVSAPSGMNTVFVNRIKLKYSLPGGPVSGKANENNGAWLIGGVDNYVTCDPADIQFEDASNPKESHSEVDAHRLKASCKEGWKLTYKADTAYKEIKYLTCESDTTDNVFKYKVTTEIEPDGKWIPKDEKIFARCAQNPCTVCKDVECATAGCKRPTFAAGFGDTCASLKCDNDRFEVPIPNGHMQIQNKAACVGGEWTIAGAAPFTKANCFTEFACNPDRSLCTGPNEKTTIDQSTGRTTVAKLECDKQTGKWMADGKEVETAANVTCTPLITTTTAATVSAVTEAVSGMALVAGCSGGLLVLGVIILAIVCWRIRRNSKRVSSSGGGNTDTPSNNTSKARKGERSCKSQTGAASSSHSQQLSGGDNHKTEKSLATAIPAEPLNSPREELEEHTPPREQQPRPATKPLSAPPSRPTPPPPPSTLPASSGSTPGTGPTTNDTMEGIKKLVDGPDGYVLIDPLEIAAEEKRRAELKRKEEAAAAATAAREKTGGTQHVGVLPPPGASTTPGAVTDEKPLSRLTPPAGQPNTARQSQQNPAPAAASQ